MRLVKSTFLLGCEEAIRLKALEHLANMGAMLFHVIGVNKDVVQINDDRDIKHISEDVIHKPLKGRRSVRKAERHNEPFKRTITSTKSGLPFITFGDANQVVGVFQIYLGIDSSSPWSV